jgi:hypothetical protein
VSNGLAQLLFFYLDWLRCQGLIIVELTVLWELRPIGEFLITPQLVDVALALNCTSVSVNGFIFYPYMKFLYVGRGAAVAQLQSDGMRK